MPSTQPDWSLDTASGKNTLVLSGVWLAKANKIPPFPEDGFKEAHQGVPVNIDMHNIQEWDTALIAFLWEVKQVAADAHLSFNHSSITDSARKLFELLPDHTNTVHPTERKKLSPLAWLGDVSLFAITEIGANSLIFWQSLMGLHKAFLRKAKLRTVDIWQNLQDSGPSALIIVGVVNFLIGAILAFVGTLQLQRFAAEAYTPNMIGIALVREMTPVMTAIVMAGRTGGSYAARISTMLGNEEIDALTVMGIPVSEYIILPAMIGLVFMLPILYLFGCLIGLIGGYTIIAIMLGNPLIGYINAILGAVTFSQFVFGFTKSIVFGAFIGISSCRIGLIAGRSAADVGIAATKAVVVGIVGVIALDAVFAVIADMVGI
ncbi:ABC transporter permease [Entomobacter blattae]|uniref:Permease MlaE n=1 Tax=Entomobacter blattae TaxID=2762277 RepID=A0A7H1NPJ3_9PROT|nr:ABC transporter permease [Entomobacter blattae]QNT77703.1 Permease MlaE [Entomobacter blattae]